MQLTPADAAEELEALAQGGWVTTVSQCGATFVVEVGGVTGYGDDLAGEGATLGEAVAALLDRMRQAYPDDDGLENEG